jgi:iron(III) transport system ATP-binding protein
MFFSDINVIHGVVENFATETPFGRFLTPGLADRADVEIIIRPQHLKMAFDRTGSGPLPTATDGVPARGQVVRARFMGNQSIVDLLMDHDGSMLKATVPGVFLPKPGTPLWLSLRRDRCFVFPCRVQSRLADPWYG